jgi:redox-sensing transcriptional repressor
MQSSSKIPAPTLARLATYFKVLGEAEAQAVEFLNSSKFEGLCGISATQVRKDLSHFGELGKPGVGYNVATLRKHIRAILNLDHTQKVAVIGAGRLGQALASYPGLSEYSFKVVALFDSDPKKVGKQVAGIEIESASTLASRLPQTGAKMAVLAVPGSEAQAAADASIAGGVRFLLNFTPAHIKVPDSCLVRDVSFTQEFAVLAYYTKDRSA